MQDERLLPVAADPACPHCGGVGFEDTADHRKRECVCQTRLRVRAYLGPMFSSAYYVRKPRPIDERTSTAGFDPAPVLRRNVLLQNDKGWGASRFDVIYRSAVKSFLLNTGMRLGFLSVGGAREVVDAAFSQDDTKNDVFDRMHAVDLLLLYLGGDPPNSRYGQVLNALIRQRMFIGKYTWIGTPYRLVGKSDGLLATYYGQEFASFIKPRQTGDAEGVGAGNFALFDTEVIASQMRQG